MDSSGRPAEAPEPDFSLLVKYLRKWGVPPIFGSLRLSRGCGLAYPSRLPFADARLAQLVERRPYKANVGGSIPSARTKSTT
jgi:hypothetical protein